MTVIDDVLATKELTDLVVEKEPIDPIEPKLSEQVVESILTELKKGNQGFGDIARKVGFDKCTKQQVVDISQKRNDRIIELNTPIIEPIKEDLKL